MSCKHFKDALIEAAAGSAEPQGDLRAHLDACADCCAAFEQEQSLFASIDASLHVTASAQVPTSLLPRVRARLNLEATPQRSWFQPLVFAVASVALVFAVFLFARSHHSDPDNQTKQTPQVPVNKLPAINGQDQHSVPGTQIVSSNGNHPQPRGHSTLLHPVTSSQPEVLVPPDEREALARLVVAMRGRREMALALLTPATQTKTDPAGFEPLQINRLEVKPLAASESGQSDGAEQEH
jgi:hypothetical protein